MHERIKDFLELVYNLYTALYIYIYICNLSQLYFRWLKNLCKSYLWWVLDLLLFSVEFHVLETKELSSFLSRGRREQSHAVWYGYSLCHDRELLHCKGDVTRCVYMERYQNVAQYCGAYQPNGIPTNFQKYRINTAIHCLCYRHKHTQIALKHDPIDFCSTNTNQLFKIPT